MQVTVNSFVCDWFGLTISTEKTEVLYQPAPDKPYFEPDIKVVGQFTNLDSKLSRNVTIDDEVQCSLTKASFAFG